MCCVAFLASQGVQALGTCSPAGDSVADLEKKEAQRQMQEVRRKQRRVAWQGLLHSTPIFEGLPAKVVGTFLEECSKLKFGEGEIIFNKGDESNEMMFIVNGTVEVSWLMQLAGTRSCELQRWVKTRASSRLMRWLVLLSLSLRLCAGHRP